MLRLSAPRLCQGDDENVILEIGAAIWPGLLRRIPGQRGLCIELEGDYRDESLEKDATRKFQMLLGVLRAWRPSAGHRVDEISPGSGPGPIQDENGNQLIRVVGIPNHSRFGGEVEAFARDAAAALEREGSQRLGDALSVFGRRDLDAAAFFNVYEYAQREFTSPKGIGSALDVTQNELGKLTNSANNLSPVEGGRHAKTSGNPPWTLSEQKEFVAKLLRNWIGCRARLVR